MISGSPPAPFQKVPPEIPQTGGCGNGTHWFPPCFCIFKRIGTAGSGAEPALEKVEFQVDAVIRLQFMFMHCPVKSLHGVTADREFHVFRGSNQDSLSCGIAQCCETDIRALAVFLRHDIRDVHFIDCGPVESDRISRFSVTVVSCGPRPNHATFSKSAGSFSRMPILGRSSSPLSISKRFSKRITPSEPIVAVSRSTIRSLSTPPCQTEVMAAVFFPQKLSVLPCGRNKRLFPFPTDTEFYTSVPAEVS